MKITIIKLRKYQWKHSGFATPTNRTLRIIMIRLIPMHAVLQILKMSCSRGENCQLSTHISKWLTTIKECQQCSILWQTWGFRINLGEINMASILSSFIWNFIHIKDLAPDTHFSIVWLVKTYYLRRLNLYSWQSLYIVDDWWDTRGWHSAMTLGLCIIKRTAQRTKPFQTLWQRLPSWNVCHLWTPVVFLLDKYNGNQCKADSCMIRNMFEDH